jgi:hypothetical protein
MFWEVKFPVDKHEKHNHCHVGILCLQYASDCLQCLPVFIELSRMIINLIYVILTLFSFYR